MKMRSVERRPQTPGAETSAPLIVIVGEYPKPGQGGPCTPILSVNAAAGGTAARVIVGGGVGVWGGGVGVVYLFVHEVAGDYLANDGSAEAANGTLGGGLAGGGSYD